MRLKLRAAGFVARPDIRYTLRGFRSSPGSFVAVISLALRSGARRRTELCLQENADRFQKQCRRLNCPPIIGFLATTPSATKDSGSPNPESLKECPDGAFQKAPAYSAVQRTDLGYFSTVFQSSTTIRFWRIVPKMARPGSVQGRQLFHAVLFSPRSRAICPNRAPIICQHPRLTSVFLKRPADAVGMCPIDFHGASLPAALRLHPISVEPEPRANRRQYLPPCCYLAGPTILTGIRFLDTTTVKIRSNARG